MGEAKRRREALGEEYGKPETILPWLPITKAQATQFSRWTTLGAWVGIILMVGIWLTVRFIGPGFGWWEISG
ncbi:DUF2839 domain-containing protein [Romeria aff. gracilis LEGE 07310]|uniref:DUF2839 domain-containing protein n=1 Tax=Vasconcelosia minhoensis LEGE 07310 TaxID=915328 RepID=A0A8J7AUE6_9CYAN|nr:DUF2839 domain-containing protein [Romeria gracilis]MBE9076893.1 DUF2839 domain-containing protein [Romeria aff. gracilis LEGE 07310]